ncbi:MAG: SCP2 sterol-binding domain-containing protein [Bdellovibrionota bacterium]
MAFTDPKQIFDDRIAAGIKANIERAKTVDAVYKFVLTGDKGGTWLVNLKDKPGVSLGDGDAGCTITMEAADFLAMNNGELDPQQAFMAGKMMITGDMSLAFKLGEVLGGGQRGAS